MATGRLIDSAIWQLAGAPTAGAGTQAPVGTILYDYTNAVYYMKYGTGATEWQPITGTGALPKLTILNGNAAGGATVTGTHTLSAYTKLCRIKVIGPGTGGGGGGRANNPVAGVTRGGGGGAAGGVRETWVECANLSSRALTYQIDPAGTGGIGATVDNTAGANATGTTPGVDVFLAGVQINWVRTFTNATGGGVAGDAGAAAAGVYSQLAASTAGAATNTAGGAGAFSATNALGGCAGSGGAGGSLAADGTTTYAGGAGTYNTTNGGNATAGTAGVGAGAGGAGAAGATTIAGTDTYGNGGAGGGAGVGGGGAGGAGAAPGGGGGGGGASGPGNNGGNGGNGGYGRIIFMEF